jgi:hypothetical protein
MIVGCDKRQMQWTPEAVHLLVRPFDDTPRGRLQTWYRELAANDHAIRRPPTPSPPRQLGQHRTVFRALSPTPPRPVS